MSTYTNIFTVQRKFDKERQTRTLRAIKIFSDFEEAFGTGPFRIFFLTVSVEERISYKILNIQIQ